MIIDGPAQPALNSQCGLSLDGKTPGYPPGSAGSTPAARSNPFLPRRYFGLLRLRPPAPATWAGVVGIVGIVLGWMVAGAILERLTTT